MTDQWAELADRYLEAVGAESREATARAGRPGDRGRCRAHRRAGAAAPEPSDPGQPQVGEGADADPLPGREAVEQRGQRHDSAIGLRVDHEARFRKLIEDMLEPWHAHAAAAERDDPSSPAK